MHFAFDLKFKHWSADRHSSMTLEAALDHIKNAFSDGHLEGVIVSCTLNLNDIIIYTYHPMSSIAACAVNRCTFKFPYGLRYTYIQHKYLWAL